MAPMFEWFSEARICASRLKRATRSGSDANVGGRTLMATCRPSAVSVARYTSPMPPAPSSDSIRYGPNLRAHHSGVIISEQIGNDLVNRTVDREGFGSASLGEQCFDLLTEVSIIGTGLTHERRAFVEIPLDSELEELRHPVPLFVHHGR